MFKNNSLLLLHFLFLLMIFFGWGCDFTPPISRKIIDAQNFITEQKYKKSSILYEEILQSNPGPELRLKICYQLGDLYSIYLGEYDKAINYFNEVKGLTEDPLWLIKTEEKLASINFSYRKKYSEAISNYEKLVSFKPRLNNADFYELQIALSYYYLKQYGDSVAQLTKIQANSNHQYFNRSFYYLGLVYFEMKDYNKALFVWSEYLKRESKKEYVIQTKFLVANVYESTENLKMAYDIYYSIVKDYPNKQVIQNRLNALYERRVSRRR